MAATFASHVAPVDKFLDPLVWWTHVSQKNGVQITKSGFDDISLLQLRGPDPIRIKSLEI